MIGGADPLAVAGPAHAALNSGLIQLGVTVVGGLMLTGLVWLIKMARDGATANRRAADSAAVAVETAQAAANAALDAKIAAAMNAQALHQGEEKLDTVVKAVSANGGNTASVGDTAHRVEQTLEALVTEFAEYRKAFQEHCDSDAEVAAQVAELVQKVDPTKGTP